VKVAPKSPPLLLPCDHDRLAGTLHLMREQHRVRRYCGLRRQSGQHEAVGCVEPTRTLHSQLTGRRPCVGERYVCKFVRGTRVDGATGRHGGAVDEHKSHTGCAQRPGDLVDDGGQHANRQLPRVGCRGQPLAEARECHVRFIHIAVHAQVGPALQPRVHRQRGEGGEGGRHDGRTRPVAEKPAQQPDGYQVHPNNSRRQRGIDDRA
jgi:hypothetical protein